MPSSAPLLSDAFAEDEDADVKTAVFDAAITGYSPCDRYPEASKVKSAIAATSSCYTPRVRRLIINADDFGLTAGVNRGIVKSHRSGIVTSTTLMACGSRFEEAAALAKEMPRLSVGCHVVLVDGVATLSASEVSSLVVNSSPRFRETLTSFAYLAVLGRLREWQIEAEITAQIQKLQSAGIAVSHLDSHKHTHMFPNVLNAMLRAGASCGVRAIRNPFEPLVFAKLAHWKRQFQVRLLRSFRPNFRQALDETGLATPDGCIGIAATGGLSEGTFCQLIENLPEGTWEFVSHPGYNDSDLDQVKTRLRESRQRELDILTSNITREVLHRERVQLISYREL
jgi:hopanoid biosynthesis associated protein HpnK